MDVSVGVTAQSAVPDLHAPPPVRAPRQKKKKNWNGNKNKIFGSARLKKNAFALAPRTPTPRGRACARRSRCATHARPIARRGRSRRAATVFRRHVVRPLLADDEDGPPPWDLLVPRYRAHPRRASVAPRLRGVRTPGRASRDARVERRPRPSWMRTWMMARRALGARGTRDGLAGTVQDGPRFDRWAAGGLAGKSL